MYGILMESLVIFRNYAGSGFLLLLYAAAAIWILLREKDRGKRILLLYVPALLLAAFFLPPVRIAYVALLDEGTTYYRLLWLVPFGLTVSYAGAQAFTSHRRIGLLLCAVLVMLGGKAVYGSVYFSRAENIWHLPQKAVELCDQILQDAEGDDGKVYCAFPAELVHYVRQYDARIILPFGREVVEPAWNHWNTVHTEMEEADVIQMDRLNELLREEGFDHLVLRKGRATDKSPEETGWERMYESEDYVIYRDGEAGR